MLLGIRKNLGARSLMVALLASAPLLASNGMALAAPRPTALHVSSARVANPSPVASRSYQRSKAPIPSPIRGAILPRAQPLVSAPGTGPQLIQDPGFEFGVG